MAKKKVVFQRHHIIYADAEGKNKEVLRRIRKGVHAAITILRRFNYLTEQEINTIKLECELKRKYEKEK